MSTVKPKILIGIHSCTRDATNGANQAIRDTWLSNIGLDHKFFIGAAPRESVGPLHKNFEKDFNNFQMKKFNSRRKEFEQHGDEVLLNAPDEYSHLSYKLKGMMKYALENNYNFLFKVDTDTFVNASLLGQQSFRDYCGVADKGVDYRTGKEVIFAFGGNGFIVSAKAMEQMQPVAVDILADDAWLGVHLSEDFNIKLRPLVEGLTDHLGQGTGQYKTSQMYQRWRWVRK